MCTPQLRMQTMIVYQTAQPMTNRSVGGDCGSHSPSQAKVNPSLVVIWKQNKKVISTQKQRDDITKTAYFEKRFKIFLDNKSDCLQTPEIRNAKFFLEIYNLIRFKQLIGFPRRKLRQLVTAALWRLTPLLRKASELQFLGSV